MEFQMDKLKITFNPEEINPEEVHEYLKTSYWASKRSLEDVKTSIKNSGIAAGLIYDGKLIGFARIVSDLMNFGMLCDVFVKEPYKGLGLGKLITKEILRHPDAKKLNRITLGTHDAQKLYEKYGFLYEDKKVGPNGWVTYSMAYGRVSDEYFIKHFTKDDMDDAVNLVESHWNPSLTRLVHPMFYHDFYKTCFCARTFEGELIGFVLAFMSQDCENEGYIHALFVHPDWRRKAVAKNLYNKLLFYFSNKGVKKVRLITTASNTLSQDYHKAIGFEYAAECDSMLDGIPVASDYYGKGKDRVVMEKTIG